MSPTAEAGSAAGTTRRVVPPVVGVADARIVVGTAMRHVPLNGERVGARLGRADMTGNHPVGPRVAALDRVPVRTHDWCRRTTPVGSDHAVASGPTESHRTPVGEGG